MAILHLTNKETQERVWVEARFSNSGVPFNELPVVPGFPRWIEPEELITIDVLNWKELLYRRSVHGGEKSDSDYAQKHSMIGLYRISMLEREEKTGFIWKLPRDACAIYANCCSGGLPPDPLELHWLLKKDSEALGILQGKFGVVGEDLERVREELKNGKPLSMIALHSKFRILRNWRIELFLKASGYAAGIVQICVNISDTKSNRTTQKMIIEAPMLQALSLIDSCSVKNAELFFKHRTTQSGYMYADLYRSNGFKVPVTVPLELQ